jgi:pimeloyl-ACP methyl ester carboxylesterase
MGGAKAHYDGIGAFSQTDFTEDLKKITVPVLVMHSEDDQIVPYADDGSIHRILERYCARTDALASSAIVKLERHRG